MSEPFLGEISIFAFNYPPQGWALCNGALLPVKQNPALYSLLKTTFGGDGTNTFGLPDLRGRVPVHPDGNTVIPGQQSGTETVVLTNVQTPAHSHPVNAQNALGDSVTPIAKSTCLWAQASDSTKQSVTGNMFASAPANTAAMDPSLVVSAGGDQAHNNMQPFLTLNYCIAVSGYYPQRP